MYSSADECCQALTDVLLAKQLPAPHLHLLQHLDQGNEFEDEAAALQHEEVSCTEMVNTQPRDAILSLPFGAAVTVQTAIKLAMFKRKQEISLCFAAIITGAS